MDCEGCTHAYHIHPVYIGKRTPPSWPKSLNKPSCYSRLCSLQLQYVDMPQIMKQLRAYAKSDPIFTTQLLDTGKRPIVHVHQRKLWTGMRFDVTEDGKFAFSGENRLGRCLESLRDEILLRDVLCELSCLDDI